MAEEKTTVEATEVKETKKPAAKKTTTKKTTTTKTTAPKKTTTKKAAPKKEAVVEEKAEEVKETKTAKKPAAKKTAKKATTKKAAPKKEAKKVVEEVKPLRTEATARAISLKVTPRKARLVIDLVRGKDVDDALNILKNTSHKAAPLIAKLIKSAYANAVNNFNLNGDKLYISNIQASDSIKMKRFLPRAKGSASGLVKRFSNVVVTVKERM